MRPVLRRTTATLATVVLLAVPLSGCGGGDSTEPAPAQPAASATPTYGGTSAPYGTQVDKARGVQQDSDAYNRNLEQQTGGGGG